ncbi:MAG: methyl-accepting chemotaxis protein [Gammaproteobacteria bacterium]|nr:methyl-accepting chemotaxis protein [Gammaproteobacteria bacterium]
MNASFDTNRYNNESSPTNKSASLIGIRARLFIGFSIITLFLLSAIIIVLYKVSSAENSAKNVVNTDLPSFEKAYDLQSQLYLSQSSLNAWLLTKDAHYKNELKRASNNIAQLIQEIDTHAKEWKSDQQLTTWKGTKDLIDQYNASEIKVMNLTDTALALQLLVSETIPLQNKILDQIDGPISATGQRVGGLFDVQTQLLTNGSQEIISNLDLIRIIEYILLVVALLSSPIIALYTVRGILHYVNTFRLHSNKVAKGDLTQRIMITSFDEMGQLGNDLNVMTENLASMSKQITDACHNMATSLEEVRHAVDVQSSGATEQASSINEITSSLEEIDKSSTQTIEKAKALGEVAERTREKGQLGLEAVEQSIGGMKSVREKVQAIAQTILDLSNQTQQVGEITGVVNTLAQQSKMLALNASIEAAKAGEAGKGFAVVASEVKNLAEQSEQSTSQVQKILEDIRHATEKAVMATEEGTKGVDQGTVLVEQTGDIVRNLSDVIHETTIATQQIEAAIRQENVGIEQITTGMNEINQVTSSFVESVKQTTEAIGSLAGMVENLKKYIDVYKV